MPHKVSPATTVCVTVAGCAFTAGPVSATSCTVAVMAEGATAPDRGGAGASRRHGAELAEDDDGSDDSRDEGGRGAVAPESAAPVPSASAKVGHHSGGDGEGEVGPGQPRERREEVGPERVGDRGPQRAGDLACRRGDGAGGASRR